MFRFVLGGAVAMQVLACGPISTTTGDGGLEDASVNLVGVVTDAGQPVDGGGTGLPSDAGAPDAGAVGPFDAGTTAAEIALNWHNLAMDVYRKFCECQWQSSGYDSLDDCLAAEADTSDFAYLQCRTDALAAAGVEQRARCTVGLQKKWAECNAKIVGCSQASISACYPNFASCPADPNFDLYRNHYYACGAGPTPGTCPTASGSSTGIDVWVGTNYRMGDDYKPSCVPPGSASVRRAPDVEYLFTAPASGKYRFDTNGSGTDTVLALYSGCGGVELPNACNDSVPFAAGHARFTARIDRDLAQGETVLVVIDGAEYTDLGPIKLSILKLQ